jgi:hypothetical protein
MIFCLFAAAIGGTHCHLIGNLSDSYLAHDRAFAEVADRAKKD